MRCESKVGNPCESSVGMLLYAIVPHWRQSAFLHDPAGSRPAYVVSLDMKRWHLEERNLWVTNRGMLSTANPDALR